MARKRQFLPCHQIYTLLFCVCLTVNHVSTKSERWDEKSLHFSDSEEEEHEKNGDAKCCAVNVEIGRPFTGPLVTVPTIPYTECGGVINAGSMMTEIIQYKHNTNYSNDELCIWTIRNTDGKSLVFYKHPSEFESGMDFIQLSTFDKDLETNQPFQSVVIGRQSASEKVILTGPVAFVVFSTDHKKVQKGFTLMVHTIGAPSYNYAYRDFFSRLSGGEMTLKPYFHNMMSTFVVSPEYDFGADIEYDTQIGHDNISVFKIERVEINEARINYVFIERNSGVGVLSYDLDDIHLPRALLVIFSTDDSVREKGIRINWISYFT